MEGADIGPTVCQGRGNRSNEILWTWHQGQLQEQAGFLLSTSLTLSSAHVSGIRHSDDLPRWPKKKKTQAPDSRTPFDLYCGGQIQRDIM